MSDISSRFGFEVVRRGYDPGQVDNRITKLVGDRNSALTRIASLESRIEELLLEAETAQTEIDDDESSYAALGARVEQILCLADEEAEDQIEKARQDAKHYLDVADGEAKRLGEDAEAYAAEHKAKSAEEWARLVEEAKGEAAQLHGQAAEDARIAYEKADAFFKETRANAARAAADFEAGLAKRRGQAERDLASRQAKAEKRLADIEHRAEQLRLGAEKQRTDAERGARQAVEAAQYQAEDIVAEANAKADRVRSESERELAAFANRRDSINAQLTNVRAMLATLTGAAVTPAVGPHDDAIPSRADMGNG